MTKYVNVKVYKNGVKRENGSGRECILASCSNDATVKATKISGDRQMEVYLCTNHAVTHGVIHAERA